MSPSQQAPEGRLVIVDDEPVILQLLDSIFQDQPWDVLSCATGNEALQAMRSGGVDVLLTDKNLPDVGGLELVRAAREIQPDAECIVLTGYASLDTALEAMKLDVFDYIVKPPKDIFEVRRKVSQAFDKQAMARENARLLHHLQQKNAELEATLEELRRVQSELIQSEKLAGIGTLAAGIAHEISSPLFGVMGLAEAIQEEDDTELVQGYASEIVEYSRAIKEIVVELSSYSRTASSEYLTTVDLPRVVEDAARLVGRSSKLDPSAIHLDLQESTYVNARTNEIQQVFVNLVKNAAEAVLERHGPEGGWVKVRLGADDQGVWAEVSDNGAGIPAESHALIFDPFYTTKPPGRGTGLGLNIVYRIVTKYRGSITVQSEAGEGTTFQLRFPVEA